MAVLGSRDQMCIHPEVSKEMNNNSKVHMCQMRVKAKTCYFNNQVEWHLLQTKYVDDYRERPLGKHTAVGLCMGP